MPELLIGCGHSREKRIALGGDHEWHDLVTLDINPACDPDILHDLNVVPIGYPLPGHELFDEIHAYEVLEHVGRQGDWRFFFDQWTDFHNMVKPDGLFLATCPHYTSPWAWGDPSHTRVIGIEAISFLSQKHYDKNVGSTAMTDFRSYYKADWELVYQHVTEDLTQIFVLKAIK